MITFTVSMDVEDFIKLKKQEREKDKQPEKDSGNMPTSMAERYFWQSNRDMSMWRYRPDFRFTK